MEFKLTTQEQVHSLEIKSNLYITIKKYKGNIKIQWNYRLCTKLSGKSTMYYVHVIISNHQPTDLIWRAIQGHLVANLAFNLTFSRLLHVYTCVNSLVFFYVAIGYKLCHFFTQIDLEYFYFQTCIYCDYIIEKIQTQRYPNQQKYSKRHDKTTNYHDTSILTIQHTNYNIIKHKPHNALLAVVW